MAARERDTAKVAFVECGLRHQSRQRARPPRRPSRTSSRRIDGKIADVQAAQVGTLKLLGRPSPGTAACARGDARELARLKSEPGRWLAAVLDRRKGEVQRLPDEEIRFKALFDWRERHDGRGVRGRDRPPPRGAGSRSASGIQTLRIELDRGQGPALAGPSRSPPGATSSRAFAKNDGGLEQVTAEPAISTSSARSRWSLGRPHAAGAGHGADADAPRRRALRLNAGLLGGSGTAPEPRGVADAPGRVQRVYGPLTLPRGIRGRPSATCFAANAVAGALVMDPVDLGKPARARRADRRRRAAVELGDLRNQGLTLPYLARRCTSPPACPQGEALLYDPATVIAVIRKEDADIAVDPYYGFDNGEMASYVRGMPSRRAADRRHPPSSRSPDGREAPLPQREVADHPRG